MTASFAEALETGRRAKKRTCLGTEHQGVMKVLCRGMLCDCAVLRLKQPTKPGTWETQRWDWTTGSLSCPWAPMDGLAAATWTERREMGSGCPQSQSRS